MNRIMNLRTQSVWREAKDYVFIALGMMMYGIGWTVFLLPNDLPCSGYRLYYLLGDRVPGTVHIFGD